MNLRNKLGQFPLVVTMTTILISSFSHAASSQARKDLYGVRTVLIDAEINLNCGVETPDLCQSRKDISIPDQTRLNLKNDIASMIPGQELAKKQLDEISALKEANEQLKGQGQELQIVANKERINELKAEKRPEYTSLTTVPALWKNQTNFYKSDSRYSNADNMIALGYRPVTIGYREELRYSEAISLNSTGLFLYKLTRISIIHSPEMMKSFVLKVDRFQRLSNENSSAQYASESMVARCEERTIYNTIAGFKTTVAEEHLLCKLPEDRGFLRFKILN